MNPNLGVGGQSGLFVSNIGPDISRLSIEGVREEREEREERDEREDESLLPLIESVSLDHEKERSERVFEVDVFFASGRGGVTSPMGMRWSPSLTDRLSLTTASRSNIVAQVKKRARCWCEKAGLS